MPAMPLDPLSDAATVIALVLMLTDRWQASLTKEHRTPAPCMPCHPHHFTQPSVALPDTTSVLLKEVEARGAVM
jgi:hypothetical protein